MTRETDILHRRVDTTAAKPNVTPLYQASSFLSESDYFYTRQSNPNSTELEDVLRDLEGARHALTVTTGMTAISLVLRLLKPGDHVVANELIYGCSYRLLQEYCAHFGIGLDIVDLTQGIEPHLRPETRLVLFESPTNPLLRTIDIAAVANAAKRNNPKTIVAVDNTWATPLYQRPLELGASVCIQSATKFFAGHSDCMGGVLTTDDDALAEELRTLRFYAGAILAPHSAWLIRRSMQTFVVRMERHANTFETLVSFLDGREEIERVYTPNVDGEQLRGYGGILFVALREELEDRVDTFMDALTLFERGTSMACVVSAVAQPFTGSHLSMSDEEKGRVGIERRLVRLCFGLEDPDDLVADVAAALEFAAARRLAETSR